MAVSMKMAVFWVVAPRKLILVYQRFRGLYCWHHQGDRVGKLLPDYTAPQPRRKTAVFEPNYCKIYSFKKESSSSVQILEIATFQWHALKLISRNTHWEQWRDTIFVTPIVFASKRCLLWAPPTHPSEIVVIIKWNQNQLSNWETLTRDGRISGSIMCLRCTQIGVALSLQVVCENPPRCVNWTLLASRIAPLPAKTPSFKSEDLLNLACLLLCFPFLITSGSHSPASCTWARHRWPITRQG
jgi:hypothetical protein